MLLQTLHIREQQRETKWKETLTRLGLNGLSVEDVEKAKKLKKGFFCISKLISIKQKELHVSYRVWQSEFLLCLPLTAP